MASKEYGMILGSFLDAILADILAFTREHLRFSLLFS